MADRQRFTQEEIELVSRLQAAPASRFNMTVFDAAVFFVLVSADVVMWSVVAMRGLKAMVGA